MNNFTIFITSYNYGHTIGKAIDSIIGQTHPGWNLYIIDNGSTDNTHAIVEKYLADPRIHLIINENNLGHVGSIVKGYTQLEGDYVSTLQADDWLEPTFVERSLQALQTHPEIGLAAFGWMAYIEHADQYIYPGTIPFPRDFSGLAHLSPHLTLGNFIPQHLIAFKSQEIRRFFSEIGEMPLQQLGEQLIIKKIEDRCGPSFYSAEVAGYWRRHDKQITGQNAYNSVTALENIAEPIIYAASREHGNSYTRFLSLAFMLATASNTPYRRAVEWMTGSGKHFSARLGVVVGDEQQALQCLACALQLNQQHFLKELATASDIRATEQWSEDLCSQFGLSIPEIMATANRIYGNHLFTHDIAARLRAPKPEEGIQAADAYEAWLNSLHIPGAIPAVRDFIANAPDNLLTIICPVGSGQLELFAATIDSLGVHAAAAWQLIVIADMEAPAGVEEIDRIHWICESSPEHDKTVAEQTVLRIAGDWIIEIPCGTLVDERLAWQVSDDSFRETCVIFCDDDLHDTTGRRHTPRFKPGVNPAALESSELAGAICVRRESWLASGGLYLNHGSPGFTRLLRIAATMGWKSIRHIPDVLLSYPENHAPDTRACLLNLIADRETATASIEVVPVTGKSWSIRYPLAAPAPRVTVTILSRGQIDLLSRCIGNIVENTSYPDYRLKIVVSDIHGDPDLDAWLTQLSTDASSVEIIRTNANAGYAGRCKAAMEAADSELVLLLQEEVVVLQAGWLEELVRTMQQPDAAAISPCLLAPGTGMIENAGYVLGLNGTLDSPYRNEAKVEIHGYLDCLKIARDVAALPLACLLMSKTAYLAAGGIDDTLPGDTLADAELSLKLRACGYRLIFQPLATVFFGGSTNLEARIDPEKNARAILAENDATKAYYRRWRAAASIDPYWNRNLALNKSTPTLETEFRAQWDYLPAGQLPRILARPIANGQGDYRVSSPLRAASNAGLATACIWIEDGPRQPTAAEIRRLSPSSLIIQNFIHDHHLSTLRAWEEADCRPFLVYALDDVITDMDETNPFRKNIPANARARLKYALERCDRLVVSTEFLAETYRHFIKDIRVVPNRLEKASWLHLQTLKRNEGRPRIGWAGGSTHQGDLVLLKEVIEKTRDEADWIFFGMCPEEIRPLLAEFHPVIPFAEYPAKLAALNLDIAVAPLTLSAFNRGKSNLRLLDYGVLGIPVVCTDIDPYRNSPACRVNNVASEWIEALRARIHDTDARMREGLALQRWVHEHYLLEDHVEEWLRAHLPD